MTNSTLLKSPVFTLFIALFLFSPFLHAQKREKIKGSKIVTILHREIDDFQRIEFGEDFEILLVRGDKPSVEVETDDNLHELIITEVLAGTLHIRREVNISSFKKLNIRVTYTATLNEIIVREKATVTALAQLDVPKIHVRGADQAKIFLNVKVPHFKLSANDKNRVELNVTSDNTAIDLDKNATLKALIKSKLLHIDQYQKTSAIVEGDVEEFTLMIDNNATFVGKELSSEVIHTKAEGQSKAHIWASKRAKIEAFGKSQVYIFGDGQIDLLQFKNDAVLFKKDK